MLELANKNVLVLGLGGRGRAACDLLVKNGAHVVAMDSANTPELRDVAEKLRPFQIDVKLGASTSSQTQFDLAVLSPAVRPTDAIVQSLTAQKTPVIGELERGARAASCLCIAIAGTNGKSTTASLVERMLLAN